ncbi:hypothetical protein JOE21_003186 [Desmospora profundinema]|uniref:Uncharacterized protein n=1 Tax=Desmospora profundinema TaxID=1571184 RepID=A0ABU1IQU8_9BACL|nr:hypothetical protein [Desmospora profundinema]
MGWLRSFALTEHKFRLGHFVPGLALRFLQEIEDSLPARPTHARIRSSHKCSCDIKKNEALIVGTFLFIWESAYKNR